jgi:hypothetical protein
MLMYPKTKNSEGSREQRADEPLITMGYLTYTYRYHPPRSRRAERKIFSSYINNQELQNAADTIHWNKQRGVTSLAIGTEASTLRRVLGRHPGRRTSPIPHTLSPVLQRYGRRHRCEECDDALRSKRPGESGSFGPRRDEEGIDKGRAVEEHCIESDNAHGVLWIAVDNVSGDGGVTHLDACGEEEEGDLADYPVVVLIDRNTPQDETDRGEGRGRIHQPQSHLRDPYAVVALRELENDPIAQGTGTEEFREQRADDETDEQQPLNLRGILDVRNREIGDDGKNPPIPAKGIHKQCDRYIWIRPSLQKVDQSIPWFLPRHTRDRPPVYEGKLLGSLNIDVRRCLFLYGGV